jgi:hypothetical protein
MPADRTNLIIRGPAVVTHGSTQLFSQGDVTVNIAPETFEVQSSLGAYSETREKDRIATITFTPVGEFESAILSALYPYSATAVGGKLFPAVAVPLTIQSTDGKLYTFVCSAVTKMPDLICSPTKTMFGPVTFTALGLITAIGTAEAWSTANSFLDITASAWNAATHASALDWAHVYTSPWSAEYGAAGVGSGGFAAMMSEDGWTCSFDMGTTLDECDRHGIINYQLNSMKATAKAKVIGPTEAEVLTALRLSGAGAVRGQSERSIANSRILKLTNAELTGGSLKIYNAVLKSWNPVFSVTNSRHGEVEFQSTMNMTSGAHDKIFEFV